jgi:hypothetical protein
VQERARNLEAQVEQLLALPAHEEEELARAGYGNRRLTYLATATVRPTWPRL